MGYLLQGTRTLIINYLSQIRYCIFKIKNSCVLRNSLAYGSLGFENFYINGSVGWLCERRYGRGRICL